MTARSRSLFPVCLLAAAAFLALGLAPAQAAEPQVAHIVFFELKTDTPETRARLVEACKKYLSDHEGTVYFSAGTIAPDLAREVNDRDFDVSLNVIFKNKAAHDAYQTHPRHLEFIKENADSWAKVRVFDSYIDP